MSLRWQCPSEPVCAVGPGTFTDDQCTVPSVGDAATEDSSASGAGGGQGGQAGAAAQGGAGGNNGQTYSCGSDTCTVGQSFCYSYAPGTAGGGASFYCTTTPSACAANPTCACLCPPSSNPGSGCTPMGGIGMGGFCSCSDATGFVEVSCEGS